jgi:hypothetical protein
LWKYGYKYVETGSEEQESQPPVCSGKRKFPRNYFANSGNGLKALIKAVNRFFPWGAGHHSKKAAAWAHVAEDFNSTLPPSHPSLDSARAKEVIEEQMSIYARYIEDSEKGSEFISGHSFKDPEVVAAMVKLLERKSVHNKKAVCYLLYGVNLKIE